MRITRLAVVSLRANDLHASVHFYRDVLGLRLLPHHGARPHFDLGGQYLTFITAQPAVSEEPDPERFPLVAFAVDDLEEAVVRLRANHVPLPWDIEEDGHSRWVMFHDPGGNLIELVAFKEAEVGKS